MEIVAMRGTGYTDPTVAKKKARARSKAVRQKASRKSNRER